jgi:hypothetical protein
MKKSSIAVVLLANGLLAADLAEIRSFLVNRVVGYGKLERERALTPNRRLILRSQLDA